VDRVRTAELKQQRDIMLNIIEARDLHADITKLLNTVEVLRSELEKRQSDAVIQVEVEGGAF
jgi:predicted kinase